MTPALQFAANHLLQSTIFAGAGALLVLALKRNRARTRYAIWLIASVKFLVPMALLVGIGQQVGSFVAPILPPMREVPRQVAFTFEGRTVAFIPPTPAASTDTSSIGAAPVFAAIWLCGCLGVAGRWYSRWRRIRTVARDAAPLSLEIGVEVRASQAMLEPAAFGILHPVLLLPAGINNRLTTAQFDAILAHELAHIRGRDNLVSALQMVVEAVFWFHPLVWWIGARMIEERERACDEDVLARGFTPHDYAEGILNVCKYYLESPLACVPGVTGANLKRRIESIMASRVAHGLSRGRKAMLAVAGRDLACFRYQA